MAKVNFQSLFQKGVYGSIRSKSTIKTYIHNVRDAFEYLLEIPKHRLENVKITRKLLHKLINIPIDDVKDKLNDLPLRTKKRIVNILIVISVSLKKEKNLKDYRAYLEELRNTLQTITDRNLPSQKQKDAWITVDQFDKIIVDLNKKVEDILVAKIFDKGTINIIQLLIILKMYRLHHLRNDYTDLLLITPKAFDKLKNNTKKNYLILTKVKRNIISMKVILNNHKTKKQFAQQTVEFTDKTLLDLVTKYIKIRPRSRYFLVNQKNKPLTKLNFSTWFRRQLRKITGKSIGSSLLRHIFCSDGINNDNFISIEDRKIQASGMLHSLTTHEEYKLLVDDNK